MEEKKDSKDLYSHLPKHLEQFSPPAKTKIKTELETSAGPTWQDFVSESIKSKYFKISASILIPAVIFNFLFLRYDDWINGCHINIQFSLLEWNNLEIKRAIKFIKTKSPKDYQKVCEYVDDIALYLPCSFSAGGCFRDVSPGQIGMHTLPRDKNGNPSFTASVIYHETCHAIQKSEGRTSGDREAECYREGYRFLKDAGISENEIPQNWKIYN